MVNCQWLMDNLKKIRVILLIRVIRDSDKVELITNH